MSIARTPRGSRGGIPSGYVLGRRSSGTGAAEMIPISELADMVLTASPGRMSSKFKDDLLGSQLLEDIISKVGDQVNTPLAQGLLNLTNHVNDIFTNVRGAHGDNTRAITITQTDVMNVTTDVTALTDTVTVLGSSVAGNTASIATESTTRASADSALSSSISTLSTTVSGHTSSISTLVASVDGVYSEYAVKIDSNGNVSGFGLIGGSTSAFTIVADDFKFVKPGMTPGSPIVAFEVNTEGMVNVLRFQGKIIADSIDDLSLATGKIEVNAVTENTFGTDAGPHTLADGTPGASTAEYPVTSFGVPSGEIGNYLFRITATIDYEVSAAASIEWRLRNNINTLTGWTDLGYASIGGSTGVVINLPDWLGGTQTFSFDIAPTNAPGLKTLTVDYVPVSTSETSWGVEVRTKDGTGAKAKNIFVTILVFKR